MKKIWLPVMCFLCPLWSTWRTYFWRRQIHEQDHTRRAPIHPRWIYVMYAFRVFEHACARSSNSSIGFSCHLSFFYTSPLKQTMINTKNYWSRKRDCAWGCARGINTIWKNLQIEKHKSGRRTFRSPDWFVLFDLQIFSGGVYPPSTTSRTISFSISNTFSINLINFFN